MSRCLLLYEFATSISFAVTAVNQLRPLDDEPMRHGDAQDEGRLPGAVGTCHPPALGTRLLRPCLLPVDRRPTPGRHGQPPARGTGTE